MQPLLREPAPDFDISLTTAQPATTLAIQPEERPKSCGTGISQTTSIDPIHGTLSVSVEDQLEMGKETARWQAWDISLRNANNKLRDDNDAKTAQIKALLSRVSQLETEKDSLSNSLDIAGSSKTRLQEVMTGAWTKSRTSSEKVTKLEDRCHALETQVRRDQQDLRSVHLQLAETTRVLKSSRLAQRELEQLLEVRTTELRDAQFSLGNPDTTSHSEVKRMVDHLNAEVFQLAALVTDQLSFEQQRSSLHLECRQLAHERVSRVVGSALADPVRSYAHGDEPILVQIIVQAYLVQRIGCAVGAWSLFMTPTQSAILESLYQKIFAGGKS